MMEVRQSDLLKLLSRVNGEVGKSPQMRVLLMLEPQQEPNPPP